MRLITAEALSDSARVAPLTLINVVDDRAAREVGSVAAGMAVAYPHVWTLGQRVGNTIVVGSARRLSVSRVSAHAAADSSPARVTSPERVAQLAEAAAPLHDE